MLGMKQIQGWPVQKITRMRPAEQTNSCGIDVDRAEIPAEQDAIGKRLDEIAQQPPVFVPEGSH